MHTARRRLLALGVLVALLAPVAAFTVPAPTAPSPPIVVDLHCDTLYRIFDLPGYSLGRADPRRLREPRQVDLDLLRRGGVTAQFFAAWVPEGRHGPAAVAFADRLLDALALQVKRNPQRMAFCRTSAQVMQTVAGGRLAALASIEGGHALGYGSAVLNNLEHFRRRGVRIISLTWNNNSALATAAAVATHQGADPGLTSLGRQVVQRMLDTGVLVDVSHASWESTRAALAVARTRGLPILATHSDCYAVCRHFRNLPDDLIVGIHDAGGVIGMNFHRAYLRRAGEATVADVVAHIDHIKQLVGDVRCIAIGADFDGGIHPARGLENVGRLGNLAAQLKQHGYTIQEVRDIFGGNFLRCLQAAEAGANRFSRDRPHASGAEK